MTVDTTPESQEYTPSTDEIREYLMVGDPKPWEAPSPEVDAREARRGAAFDRWLAAHDEEVARKAAESFVALNDVFLHMRDRVAGYVGAPPVPGFFADGAAAFEWAATNIRRVRDGQSPLEPPTPEQSRARAEQIGENHGERK